MKISRILTIFWCCLLYFCLLNYPIESDTNPSQKDIQIFPLPDLLEPIALEVTPAAIYIPEVSGISVYSMGELKLDQKFGKRGEGPGEFPHTPFVTAYPEFLLINNSSKLLYYSHQGKYIKEKKIPFSYNYWAWPLLAAGENYVGIPMEITEDKQFLHVCKLFDASFQSLKVLTDRIVPLIPPPPPAPRPGARSIRLPKQDYQAVPDCIECMVNGKKIFLADTRKGFCIAVFDQNGNPLYTINMPQTNLKISSGYKDDFKDKLESLPQWDRMKDIFRVRFPEVFPAFFSVKMDGDRIHVVTYAEKDGRYEIITLDLKGKEIARSYCFPLRPFARIFSDFPSIGSAYDICAGKLYYLSYDDGTDVYNLNILDLH